jgi:hypothetical protein
LLQYPLSSYLHDNSGIYAFEKAFAVLSGAMLIQYV